MVTPTGPTSAYAVAIVTGGSCGIGRELARRGYAVVVVDLRDQGEAEAAVEEILAANGTALTVRADVTDELDVERLFDETTAAFGEIDVVVHAAIRGSSVVYQEAARRLRHGGAIVNVSSSDAITPALAHARHHGQRAHPGAGASRCRPRHRGSRRVAGRMATQPGGVTRACTGANGRATRDRALDSNQWRSP